MLLKTCLLTVFMLMFVTRVRPENDTQEDSDDALVDVCPIDEEPMEEDFDEQTCTAPGHPCDSNPCQNGGTCYEKFGALTYYRCFCTQKWIGQHCENPATKPKPMRPQYPGRYIPCHANKFNKDGICFDDLYDF